MQKNDKPGFFRLAKQSLAIVTASLTSLFSNEGKALPHFPKFEDAGKNLNYESFQQNHLNKALVLKLNSGNADSAYSHTSHSSHSSHASHSSYSPPPGHVSHASHASHMSSSPGYPSTTTTPVYKPKTSFDPPVTKPRILTATPVNPVYNPKEEIFTPPKTTLNPLPYVILGSRILHKGCIGTDVKELQDLLIVLGYDVIATGYFDLATEEAVKDFQNSKHLKVDGRVGKNTLRLLQNK